MSNADQQMIARLARKTAAKARKSTQDNARSFLRRQTKADMAISPEFAAYWAGSAAHSVAVDGPSS